MMLSGIVVLFVIYIGMRTILKFVGDRLAELWHKIIK